MLNFSIRNNLTIVVMHLFADQLGSTRAWSNGTGTVYGSQRYKPWGETDNASGSTASTDYLFTGQRGLAALGIYDYQARFYDPALGRFLQPDSIIPDPYNPMSWDRYAYVQNSPTNLNDPTGHSPCGDWDACKEENNPSTPPPPYKPTSTSYPTMGPIKPVATLTPTPEFRADGRSVTSTPSIPIPTTPTTVTKEKGINWNKVDKIDAGIDIVGIVGEGANFVGTPGKIIYGVSEIAEVAGVGKDIYDIYAEKDISNAYQDLSLLFSKTTMEKLLPDGLRMSYGYGFIFNIISLVQNVVPAIEEK